MLEIDKNVKTRKIANILETAENFAKFSKFQSWGLLLSDLLGIIIGFQYYQKMFQIRRYF